MKYIKLFEQRYENFDLMTMGSNELIELLKLEIEKEDYDIEYIKEIIEWGHFDIDVLWKENFVQQSFLIKASTLNKADIVKVLLDGGADPNLQNDRGRTALIFAAERGRAQAVRELLKHPKIKPNLQDEDGVTALMLAASRGETQAVQELLKHPDIDPNLQDNRGYTALMLAASYGATQAVQELLKRLDIDPNLKGKYGQTALMEAAYNGNTEAVQELLSHPAIDITLTDDDDETAWDLARHEIREQFPELKPYT